MGFGAIALDPDTAASASVERFPFPPSHRIICVGKDIQVHQVQP